MTGTLPAPALQRAVRLAATVALLLALAGCAAMTLVEPAATSVRTGVTVTPSLAWSRLDRGRFELWTVDGPALQALRFFRPIEHGEGLIGPTGDDKLPVFRRDMNANDIQELVVDTLSRNDFARVEPSGLAPVALGAVDGLRFDLTMSSADGLAMRGLVYAFVHRDALHLVLYTGTRDHYFPRYEQEVVRMLGGMRLAT